MACRNRRIRLLRLIPTLPVVALLFVVLPLGSGNGINQEASSSSSALMLGLAAAPEGSLEAKQTLQELRKLRNSRAVLEDISRLNSVTDTVETAMEAAFLAGENKTRTCDAEADVAPDGTAVAGACTSKNELAVGKSSRRPGNFHGVKRHTYYVGAISEAHPSLPFDAVQSIVGSEWYHPGLTAKAVWCVENCGGQFSLAQRLDANFEKIRNEIEAFFKHPDSAVALKGVGTHTTQFDKLIAGNGTWVDVRIWRGRAYNRRFCERHFRVICSIVESSPEIWTNPWSHVLLSILMKDSWVPFHQGHTNGQLTYHFPVSVPSLSGVAELAVVDRGGSLPETSSKTEKQMLTHPEERVVRWKKGKTLVFDDSFTHAVRFRTDLAAEVPTSAPALPDDKSGFAAVGEQARVVLLLRGWHPEFAEEEREALREFVRRGGEEEPEGYSMMPISKSAFRY